MIAKKAAVAKGHDIADIILCCRAPNINSGAVADELAKVWGDFEPLMPTSQYD